MGRLLGEGPSYGESKFRLREPVVHSAPFDPKKNTYPDSVSILIPPLLIDPRDRSMAKFAQMWADTFEMPTYTMDAQIPKGYDHSPRAQAEVIAEQVKTLVDEREFRHIYIGGISQGGNKAKSLATILIHQYGLPVETLAREHSPGDHHQPELLHYLGYARDITGTVIDIVLHPGKKGRNIPDLTQLLRDSYRGLRRTVRNRTFRDEVRACVGINHDGRHLPDNVVVYSRHGSKDSVSPFEHIVANPLARARDDRVRAHMRSRYGTPWIVMQDVPGGRHHHPFTDTRAVVHDARNAIRDAHLRRQLPQSR